MSRVFIALLRIVSPFNHLLTIADLHLIAVFIQYWLPVSAEQYVVHAFPDGPRIPTEQEWFNRGTATVG